MAALIDCKKAQPVGWAFLLRLNDCVGQIAHGTESLWSFGSINNLIHSLALTGLMTAAASKVETAQDLSIIQRGISQIKITQWAKATQKIAP